MRLLGAGFLWTSLICAGAVYSIKLKKHIVLLEKTRLMIEEMKIQLKFLNLPIYEMLYLLHEKEYLSQLSFLGECCELMKKGVDFPTAWKASLENSVLLYKSDETDRLLHLGLNLGVSDTENQLSILNMSAIYFDEFLVSAKQKNKKYGNLATMLSILSGCMIFILMI